MTVYEGIPIDESGLIMGVIFSSVFSVLMLGLVLFWVIFHHRLHWKGISPKEKCRMEKMASCAENNEWMQKELAKRKRKEIRQKKRARIEWAEIAAVLVLLTAIFLWGLLGLTVPTWMDYCQKDYAVYAGKFEVTYSKRHLWVELDNGEDLMGVDLPEGTYNGTIVYSKRSKIVLASVGD